jgi:diaminohydroxyphosphoribosylaminopyrimidine deaminase/5-amino-6-(5-phosphoribosylamino)uracil reductase
MVGCVIVDAGGRVLGEGYHHECGGPHAEVWALRSAGAGVARGATAFVTLEPCSHFGRTPPCSDALIEAGISRVVVAMDDPDTRVSGAGIARLQEAGVIVSTGVLEADARSLNAAYVKHRTTGRPWVVLKTAVTLDGKIATVSGDSRWITSPVARAAVHRQFRDRCDAVLCGVGTVIADDPRLTTRLRGGGRNPWRVIVDSRGRTPAGASAVLEAQSDGKTIIATTDAAPGDVLDTFAASGCQILKCAATPLGRVSLVDLMDRLGARGDIIAVVVESGSEISADLVSEGLVDRWVVFIAPKVVGGAQAPSPIGGRGVEHMASALKVSHLRMSRCGPDIRIDGKLG